jgi:hypothetical protein
MDILYGRHSVAAAVVKLGAEGGGHGVAALR